MSTLETTNNYKPSTETACTHCGQACGNEPVMAAAKPFCCEGCKMVYALLTENGLGQYYTLQEQPGITTLSGNKNDFTWLDEPDIRQQLLDFQEGGVSKITLHLPQIHCASCIWLLENLYKLEPAILQSKVNFLKREAQITFDSDQLSLRKLVELLDRIGYLPKLTYDNLGEQKETAVDRSLYYRIGVAGFAFGNIMLMSFPEYLGLTDPFIQHWLALFNVVLSIPVLFYSGNLYWRSAFAGLRQKHLNIDVPISIGMFALFGQSLFEIFSQTGSGYLDSLAGLVFFMLVGRWFQQKTYNHLSFERDYKSYFPVAATVLDASDQERSVSLQQLKVGDRLRIRHQELIPADGLLSAGEGKIDYSFVTGEAEPIPKQTGDLLYAGGKQMGDSIEVVLTKPVAQSYLTELWNDDAFEKKTKKGAEILADKVGKYFTIGILVVAFFTLAYWLPKDTAIAWNSFTAVLIVACPCAVALAIPFTLGNALRWLGKYGFYLKNTTTIEHLAQADTVVFDKTGTLTTGEKPLISFEWADGFGDSVWNDESAAIHRLVNESTHPLSRIIDVHLQEQVGFGAVGKPVLLSYAEFAGKGIQGNLNGHTYKLGSAMWLNQLVASDDRIGSRVFVTKDDQPLGSFFIQHGYREGLNTVLSHWAQTANLHLISGDNASEAAVLAPYFPQGAELKFDQKPKDKLDYIRQLQSADKQVVMVGDGLNDAGALQQSNVGIVIAESSNNFTPACDAILEANLFERLPDLLRYVRASRTLVYWAFAIALCYNLTGLSFAVQGLLSPVIAAILMPLSSITIAVFGVVSTTVLAKKYRLTGK